MTASFFWKALAGVNRHDVRGAILKLLPNVQIDSISIIAYLEVVDAVITGGDRHRKVNAFVSAEKRPIGNFTSTACIANIPISICQNLRFGPELHTGRRQSSSQFCNVYKYRYKIPHNCLCSGCLEALQPFATTHHLCKIQSA